MSNIYLRAKVKTKNRAIYIPVTLKCGYKVLLIYCGYSYLRKKTTNLYLYIANIDIDIVDIAIKLQTCILDIVDIALNYKSVL